MEAPRQHTTKTYLFLASRLKINVEVPPKIIDFTSPSHAIKNIVCISRPLLDAQIISSEDLVIIHVARTIEEVDDPFIEMVAPVGEGVGELGSRLALSVETKGSGQRGELDQNDCPNVTYFPRKYRTFSGGMTWPSRSRSFPSLSLESSSLSLLSLFSSSSGSSVCREYAFP